MIKRLQEELGPHCMLVLERHEPSRVKRAYSIEYEPGTALAGNTLRGDGRLWDTHGPSEKVEE